MFLKLTQHTDGRLPTTEAEYRAVIATIKRLGRVIEHLPGNIAGSLAGGGGYLALDDGAPPDNTAAYMMWDQNQNMGQTQTNIFPPGAPQSPWEPSCQNPGLTWAQQHLPW